MAHFKTALATLALFLFLAAPQTSHAWLTNLNIVSVDILGIVYCTASGNPEASCGGVNCPGANVTITCKNVADPLVQTVTDLSGAFKATLDIVQTLSFDADICNVHVTLPVVQYDQLPTSGLLEGALSLVSYVAFGGLATFKTLPLFSLYGGL